MARKRARTEREIQAEAARRKAQDVRDSWDRQYLLALRSPLEAAALKEWFDDDWRQAEQEDADRAQDRFGKAVEFLEHEIESALRPVHQLRDALATRVPTDALRWSDEAFRGAAEAEVLANVLYFIREKGTARLLDYIQERVLRAASECAPRSTSQPSNLIEAYRAMAWARVRERGILYLANW